MSTGLGHYGWVWIVALVALLALVLFRRGRRLIGHQRINEKRIFVRIMLLILLIVFALSAYSRGVNAVTGYETAVVGFVIGVAIALLALRFTQMGRDEQGAWYVPNLYLGIGLIALLVVRFVYEFYVLAPQIHREAAASGGTASTPVVVSSPLLHGILFLVLGYYLIYYVGVLWRSRRLPPPSRRGGP